MSRRRNDAPREPPVIAGRVPPHDLDAEAAVLSASMLSRDALDTSLELLEAQHFYSEANQRIFEACAALAELGSPVDIITVGGWLRDRELIHGIGGTAYLGRIVDATPAVANVATHAERVRELWGTRRLIATCQTFAARGYAAVVDRDEAEADLLGELEQAIYGLTERRERHEHVWLKDALTSTFQRISKAAESGARIAGTPTRYIDLDQKTAGLHRGDLMIVAARPGMGKTAFVLNLAVNVASPTDDRVMNDETGREEDVKRPGGLVCLFSLEMPREQVAARIVCSEARVDLGKLRQGHLSADDWANLTSASSVLAELPLLIDDQSGITIAQLRSKLRRMVADYRREWGAEAPALGLVIIDYLQLMAGRKGAPTREQEVSEISRGLKELAKEFDVPVIALSQLNRGVETRSVKDKRPLLSDLRESGAIEQDADTIVFIYRDEYYNKDKTNDRGIAELIVAKQRNGPTGTVRVRFISSCTKFENLAPGEYEEFDDFGGSETFDFGGQG